MDIKLRRNFYDFLKIWIPKSNIKILLTETHTRHSDTHQTLRHIPDTQTHTRHILDTQFCSYPEKLPYMNRRNAEIDINDCKNYRMKQTFLCLRRNCDVGIVSGTMRVCLLSHIKKQFSFLQITENLLSLSRRKEHSKQITIIVKTFLPQKYSFVE